jgi:hypothetical protein
MQNLDQRIRPRANVDSGLATAQHAESRFDDVRGGISRRRSRNDCSFRELRFRIRWNCNEARRVK